MLNGIIAGLGDARQSKEATLAATRLWNDLRLARGCKDRAEKPALNDRCQATQKAVLAIYAGRSRICSGSANVFLDRDRSRDAVIISPAMASGKSPTQPRSDGEPAGDGLTPMMQQYRRVKHQIPPDALLLFRLGDFYEMFFDDAKTGSQLLNLALTNRNGVPMCGIPHHAAETYIGKLLRQGRKVAICDQLEEAKPGKLVNRDVTQILSPGTHFDAHLLHAERNNFLAAICGEGPTSLGWRSSTCSDPAIFKVTELSSAEQLHNELTRTRPAEIIVPGEWFDEAKSVLANLALPITPHDGWTFERETAFFTLRDHFKTQSLDGFGAGGLSVGIGAAGAALHYLQQSLRRSTSHIHRLTVYSVSDFMVLDATTQRRPRIARIGSLRPGATR